MFHAYTIDSSTAVNCYNMIYTPSSTVFHLMARGLLDSDRLLRVSQEAKISQILFSRWAARSQMLQVTVIRSVSKYAIICEQSLKFLILAGAAANCVIRISKFYTKPGSVFPAIYARAIHFLLTITRKKLYSPKNPKSHCAFSML